MYSEKTLSCIAASRRHRAEAARRIRHIACRWRQRTTHEPSFCSVFFSGEKCSISVIGRAPTTICASPRRIGSTSFGMSSALYWLSASVLTMTSAPARRRHRAPP